MKENNVVLEKSYMFALNIVRLCKGLMDDKKEFILSKQLLRSGTSIGANLEEAIGGQSDKDFISKPSIAYKEARESHYWIRLLRDTGYLNVEESVAYLSDCDELLKIIGSIIKTMKTKLNY